MWTCLNRIFAQNQVETGDKKIWTLNEIAKMKPHEFLKNEKEIDLARAEGRIR